MSEKDAKEIEVLERIADALEKIAGCVDAKVIWTHETNKPRIGSS